MDITIEYCTMWNYQPRAAGLADELEQALDVKATLVGSSGGAFEITVDGELIFSKLKNGRFPQNGEIVRTLKG